MLNDSGAAVNFYLGNAPASSSGSFVPLVVRLALANNGFVRDDFWSVLVEGDLLRFNIDHQPVRVIVSGAILTA